MAAPVVKVFTDELKVQVELCSLVEKVAKIAINKRDSFVIGVSGGSLAKTLCSGLLNIQTNWSKWHIVFCDERVVPFDNDYSTYRYYKDNLVNKIPDLQDEQVIKIDPELPVSECASDYARQVLQLFPNQAARVVSPSPARFIPRLDMALLGMGPDGHTCSLFPNHPLLQEKDLLVGAIEASPKPPPQRVTFTYPLLNRALYVVFVATGEGKAEMLKRVIDEGLDPELPLSSKLPSARVSVEPGKGELLWYVDKGAARLLPTTHSNIMYYLPIESNK